MLAFLIAGLLPPATAQVHVGSGRALRFDGVDDYVDLGNIYDNLILPFTMTDIQGKSFLWSTGETTPSIVVTRSGTYAVKVSQGCFFDQDSVTILL